MTEQPILLSDYGVLSFRGPDARTFLQGQLSNDLRQLRPDTPLLAGLHNPQGRVIALMRLVDPGTDAAGDVLAVLPAELLSTVATLLRRFVLRARLSINDVSADWQVLGQSAAAGPPRLTLAPRETDRAVDAHPVDAAVAGPAGWPALQVAAGMPEVFAATSGEFVAQMLNLDCIGAIAWNKGCYTGQEIIARAHYRGQVKRRMRRFACATDLPPLPGSTWTTHDGLAVRVVRSARTGDAQCEILAVAPAEPRSVDERPLPYALPAAGGDEAP